MGFEVTYHFYPKKDEGSGYQVESPQTFTKQIGKLEEVPVEKLASSVMAQLARRDIMVYDVEISEYTKKKISFKETKGGILIKNKKFMLDGTVEVVGGEEELPPADIVQAAQINQAQFAKPATYEKSANQAIRWEVFDPDPPIAAMLLRKYKLTVKRKYPILDEKTTIQRINLPGGGATEMPAYEYIVIDDQGQKVKIPSMHFTPEQKGLIGMEQMVRTERDYANAPRLMHMDQYSDPGMPTLRR